MRLNRKKYLINQYGQEDAGRILKRELWPGMTSQMVIEVMGNPKSIEAGIKGFEARVYRPLLGKHTTRVTLVNGIVTGWEKKEKNPAKPKNRGFVWVEHVCSECGHYYSQQRLFSNRCPDCRHGRSHEQSDPRWHDYDYLPR